VSTKEEGGNGLKHYSKPKIWGGVENVYEKRKRKEGRPGRSSFAALPKRKKRGGWPIWVTNPPMQGRKKNEKKRKMKGEKNSGNSRGEKTIPVPPTVARC